MPTADRQRCRLGGRLVALNPDHLGARHHHLAGRGVAKLEDRLDHPALVCGDHAALLGQVDDFAQLDLGRERPVSQAPPRRDRVTEHHQHRGIGISSAEITCSGRAVVNAMLYACWRPRVRGPTPMTTKLVSTMMAAAPNNAQSRPKLS